MDAPDGQSTSDGVATRSNRWPRSTRAAVLALGATAQAALFLVAGRNLVGPALHPDGDGYLLVARVLAGGPDASLFESRPIGYPLLMTPAYWFATDALAVYRATQLVTAALVAVTFLLSYRVGRTILGLAPRAAFLAAMVATALPAVQIYGLMSLSEVATAPTILGWLLCLHLWLTGPPDRRQLWYAGGAGTCAAFAFLTHHRWLIVLVAHGVVIVAALLLRWINLRAFAVSAAAMVAVGGAGSALNAWVAPRVHPQPLPSISGRLVDGLTTVSGLVRTFSDGLGQLWYLALASWGLAAVGLAWSVVATRRAWIDRQRARTVVLVSAAVVTLGTALFTAATIPDENRVGNHAYGRYLAPLTAFWAMAGLAALLTGRSRRGLRWLTAGGLGIAVTTVVLRATISANPGEDYFAIDFPEPAFLVADWSTFRPARAAVVTMAILAAATLLLARRRRVAEVTMCGLVALGCLATVAITDQVLAPRADLTSQQAWLVRDAQAGPSDVVAASTELPLYVQVTHQREIAWSKVVRYEPRVLPTGGDRPDRNLLPFAPIPAGATLVIAPWVGDGTPARPPAGGPEQTFWDGRPYGWHIVARDENNRWAAWRRL